MVAVVVATHFKKMERHYPEKNSLEAEILVEMAYVPPLCLASLDGSFVPQKNLAKTY